MNKSGNLRYKETEEKIKSAFTFLLEKCDINNVSVNKLCDCAKISRTSFYSHYEDINDLMIKIEREKSAQAASILARANKLTKEDFVEYLTYIEANKSFYKAYFTLGNSTLYPSIMNLYIKNNDLNPSSDLKYRMLFFMAGLKAVVSRWLFYGTDDQKEEIANILHREYILFENSVV